MTQSKIPFRKLKWRDNTTDLGKESGHIYWIGTFEVPIIEYTIANSYAGCKIQENLIVFGNHKEIGKFHTIEEAKGFCQRHFQDFIIQTFFDIC